MLDREEEDEPVIGLPFSCSREVGVRGESAGGCDEVEERG